MQSTKRFLALLLCLVLLLSMSQVPHAFAMEGTNEMAKAEELNVQEETTPDVTEDTSPDVTEDTTPEVTEDTSPEETEPPVPEEPEPVMVTITGQTVDEDNTPLTGCTILLNAMEGYELPGEEWSKLEFSPKEYNFEFEIPANVAYRMVICHDDKCYGQYHTTVIASEDTDLATIVVPYARVNLTFTLVNASASCLTVEGGSVLNQTTNETNPISVRYGTTANVKFTPVLGCVLPAVCKVDDSEVALVNDGLVIESCVSDITITLSASDVTAPNIKQIEIADKTIWTQSKIVTITASDNVDDAADIQIYTSKTLYSTAAEVAANATLLPDHKDVVTENAIFYAYAIDAAGNMGFERFEVTMIDRESPVISDFNANTSFWALHVVYSAHIEDNAQLCRVYWVSHLGIEHDLSLTDDGNYEFTVYYNGTISLIAEDVAGNRTTVSATVENIDNDPPTISDIVVQESWDATQNLVMFSANDNAGVGSVVIINAAGEETELQLAEEGGTYRYYATANGNYTIRVTDIVGNETTGQFEVSRIDTEAPCITSVSMSPDQEWTNESITVSAVAADSQSGVDKLYIIAGSELGDETPLEQWQPMTFDEETGKYNFTIDNTINRNEMYYILCTDKVGRQSELSALQIRIDITAPEVSAITPNVETWSQQITYTFHVEDNGEIYCVSWFTASGTETIISLDENGNGEMTVTENGEHKIRATDKAGNVTEVTVAVEQIDLEAPVIVSVTPQTTWDATKNTASIVVTDNREIQKVYVVDAAGTETVLDAINGVYVFETTENAIYTVHAIDVAGNESTAPFTIDHIDTEAPSIMSVIVTPDVEWTNTSRTVSVEASDTQSGIDKVYIIAGSELSETTTLEQWQEMTLNEAGCYVFTIENTQDCFDTYYIQCADQVGRLSEQSSVYISIDITPPEVSGITLDADTWAQEVTYNFVVTDNGLLDTVTWVTPGGTQTVLDSDDNGIYTKTVIENGEHKILATDKAGNVTEVIIPVNLIDREAPTIVSIAPQMVWDAEENTAYITVEDNREIERVYVTAADGSETTLDGENGVYVFSTLTNGIYTAYVRDVAGNESSVQFTIDHIDTESPEITGITLMPDVEWCAEPVTITVQATDSQSGIKTVRVITQSELLSDNAPAMKDWQELQAEADGSFTFVVPNDVDSIETYHFVAEDNVGRFSVVESRTVKIDVTAPTIFDVEANTDIWSREVVYTFKVTDNDAMQSVKLTTPSGQTTVYELSETSDYEFTAIENGDFIVEAVDMAGNLATYTITVSKVDRVDPLIERIEPQMVWHPTENTTNIYATDNAEIQRVFVTDVYGNKYELEETGDNLYPFTTLYNGIYTVTVVDVAGNSVSAEFTVHHIDAEIPTIESITKDPDAQWTTHAVTVTVVPADSQSGVKAVYAAAESVIEPSADISQWTPMQKTDAGYIYVIPNDKDSLDTYHFIVEDNVGRLSEIETFVIGIDVTAPESVVVSYDRGELSGFFKELLFFMPYAVLYRDFVTVNATASDLSCGVNRYEYQLVKEGESLSENKWRAMPLTDGGNTGKATIVIRDTDFIGEIYVRVYDNLGNCTQAITDTENGETVICVLENTPDEYDQRSEAPALTTKTENPDGSYEPGVWTKADVVVHAESEGPVSGVMLFQYQIVPVGQMLEESKWINLEPMKKDVQKAEIRISEDANVDVYMRTVSNAENASKYSRVRVRVQKTLPQNATVSVMGNMGTNNWYVGLPTITITPPQVDSMASPVTTIYSLIKDGEAATAEIYGDNKPVIRGDGVYYLSVWTVDEARNKCAKTYNETIYVDTSAPTNLTLDIGNESILAKTPGSSTFDQIYDSAVTVMASANCDISGLASLSYQKVYNNAAYNPNGTWTAWPNGGLVISDNENCVVYLRAIDMAGNTTIVHSEGIIIDDTAPQGDGQENISIRVVGANANGFFAGDGTVDVTIVDPVVNDAMSGLNTIYYQVITDGVVTQEEIIRASSSGTNIKTVSAEAGNNGYISKWNGRITIRAAANNSDNITVKVTATDIAGNRRTTSTTPGAVKIDTTAPKAMLSYDNNRHQQHKGVAYFDANRTLTIMVTERDLGPAGLTVTRNGQPYSAPLSWTKTAAGENGDESVYTASFTFSEDGEYHIKFDAKDLAGNSLAELKFSAASAAREAFVIDKTAPKITVTYDNEKPGADHYFDAPRTATITVIDDNFDPAMFEWTATASLDGEAFTAPVPGVWAHNENTHTVTVRFDKDGDYEFTCSCKDNAGNASGKPNYGTGKVKNSFTIDQTPVDVKVEGLENKTSYNSALAPIIRYHDVNLKEYNVTLKVTNMETIGVDVTKEFIQKDADGEIRLVFPEDKNVDGIYELEYEFYDKAAHKTSATYKFTVNRNGSVFEYSDDLIALLNNYVYDANGVYTITEYNPGQVETRTITITRDGAPIADPQWNMENQDGSESKWHRYEYTVLPQNFTEDGRYRITIASDDNAKNRTEATPDILFWVDKTAPELPLITGLEDDIVNAKEMSIKIQAYDTIGIAKILIELTDNDGVTRVLLEEEIEEGETSAERTVVIGEGLRQHLRVVVTDRAGNTIDTDGENFAPAYTFEKKVTVSENILTRWYADPWKFYGSIGGFAALIAVIAVLLANARKRKKARTRM